MPWQLKYQDQNGASWSRDTEDFTEVLATLETVTGYEHTRYFGDNREWKGRSEDYGNWSLDITNLTTHTREGHVRKVLPLLDVRGNWTRSPIIVALHGMVPGNEGDMRTGNGDADYVHVTRNTDTWRAIHIRSATSYTGDDIDRASRFIWRHIVVDARRWQGILDGKGKS
jgi:hypothetical protein